jgi:hypothetical protein
MGKKQATLCGVSGHWWQPAMAGNYRWCGRTGCQAVERWDGQRWVRVPGGMRTLRQMGEQQQGFWK